jgi:hypothetical protein
MTPADASAGVCFRQEEARDEAPDLAGRAWTPRSLEKECVSAEDRLRRTVAPRLSYARDTLRPSFRQPGRRG